MRPDRGRDRTGAYLGLQLVLQQLEGPQELLPEVAEIEVMMAPKVLARCLDVKVNGLNEVFLLPD